MRIIKAMRELVRHTVQGVVRYVCPIKRVAEFIFAVYLAVCSVRETGNYKIAVGIIALWMFLHSKNVALCEKPNPTVDPRPTRKGEKQ